MVEIDGRSYHDTTAAFERDRLRGNEVGLAGWLALRFTRRRVVLVAATSSATSKGPSG